MPPLGYIRGPSIQPRPLLSFVKMKWTAAVLLLFLGSASVWATPARFDDYQMYNLVIETEDQLTTLQSLTADESLIFVDPLVKVGQRMRMIIAPKHLTMFNELSDRVSLNATLLVTNVQKLMDKEVIVSLVLTLDTTWKHSTE